MNNVVFYGTLLTNDVKVVGLEKPAKINFSALSGVGKRKDDDDAKNSGFN
ncbi:MULTISPECIES: hypothetical protein [Aneurinibacillus]|jgi:hypothetical protein|nr:MULTISPECIES: hypothetical protein [Aneurinibacillus]MED0679448.1 hypothetical protein [Aneurinibacillus thermoaerophilus]